MRNLCSCFAASPAYPLHIVYKTPYTKAALSGNGKRMRRSGPLMVADAVGIDLQVSTAGNVIQETANNQEPKALYDVFQLAFTPYGVGLFVGIFGTRIRPYHPRPAPCTLNTSFARKMPMRQRSLIPACTCVSLEDPTHLQMHQHLVDFQSPDISSEHSTTAHSSGSSAAVSVCLQVMTCVIRP